MDSSSKVLFFYFAKVYVDGELYMEMFASKCLAGLATCNTWCKT